MPNRLFQLAVTCCLLLSLSACTQFQTPVQEPVVRLDGARFNFNNPLMPQVFFDLHITNPNSFALPVRKLDYNIAVLGVDVLNGSNSTIGNIAANGEAKLTLQADSKLSSLLMLAQRVRQLERGSEVSYSALINIDLGGFLPTLKIEKSDRFPLNM